jgi:hypothetical protein
MVAPTRRAAILVSCPHQSAALDGDQVDVHQLVNHVDVDRLLDHEHRAWHDYIAGSVVICAWDAKAAQLRVPRPRALAVGQSGRDGWTIGGDHPPRVTRRDGRDATVAVNGPPCLGARRITERSRS